MSHTKNNKEYLNKYVCIQKFSNLKILKNRKQNNIKINSIKYYTNGFKI